MWRLFPSMKGVGNAITKAFGGVSESVGRSEGMKIGGGISAGIGAKLGAVAGVAGNVAGRVIDAFKDLSGEIVSASDSAQKFGSTLQFAGVSTKQIKALTKSTQDYADKTVYDLNDIRNTTSQLAANGVPNYAKLAEAAGNLNAVAGGSSETFKSVAMVLTQTAGAGKLTTENWNQLSDAIPGASGKLQEAMKKNGAYTGNFRDAMAKGEITADEFNKAIMQLGMTAAAKEAATSTTTIEGSLGNLEAAAVKAGMTVLDSVKPMVTGAMNGVSDALTFATPVIQNAIQGTIKWFQDLYRQLQQNGALTTFKQVWDSLVGVVKKASGIAVNWMKSLPPGGAANAIKAVADALQWIIDNKGLVLTALAAIGGGFATLKTITTVTSAINSVKTAVIGFSTAVKSAGGVIKLLSAALGTGPWGLLATAIAVVVAGLVYFFTQTETGRQLWASFTSFLASAWQTAVDTFKSIGQSIVTFFTATLPAAIQSVGQWFQQLPGNIASWLMGAVTAVSAWASSMASQAVSAGIRFISSVGSALSQMPGCIGGWLNSALSSVASFASQMGSRALQAGQQFVSSIIGVLSSLPGRMVSIGSNIVSGIVSGIKNSVGNIASSLLSGVKNAVDAVKSKLGIHSPSRLMRDEVGVMVGRGLALGIDDSASSVARSMGGLTGMLATPSLPTPCSVGGWRDSARIYSPAYDELRPSGRTVNATYNVYANDPDLVVAKISRRQNMLETANGGY